MSFYATIWEQLILMLFSRLPLTQCKQKYASMDSGFKTNIKAMICENMNKYGYDKLTFNIDYVYKFRNRFSTGQSGNFHVVIAYFGKVIQINEQITQVYLFLQRKSICRRINIRLV